MPSVAVDGIGNMAIGYSVSDATMYPAIRYSGRLAGDPVNTITQTETSLIEGTGGQVHTFIDGTLDHRWGDYSALTLDPDGCTFWYTNEYYTSAEIGWHTQIGSFAYPGCLQPTAAEIVSFRVRRGVGKPSRTHSRSDGYEARNGEPFVSERAWRRRPCSWARPPLRVRRKN